MWSARAGRSKNSFITRPRGHGRDLAVFRDEGTAIVKIATPRRAGAAAHLAASDEARALELLESRSSCVSQAVWWGPRLLMLACPHPNCLAVDERADGSAALWLEDVVGSAGTASGSEELGDVAYRLGVGHARWLGRPADDVWLARDFLREYTTALASAGELDWDHPVAVAAWRRDCGPTCDCCGNVAATCWPPPTSCLVPSATTTSGR